MRRLLAAVLTLAPLLAAASAHAQITRWDTGKVIPDTKGVTPGPGLRAMNWDLRYADLSGGLDLHQANFWFTALDNAHLSDADLTQAQLGNSKLTNADFTGAVVAGANFGESSGFTQQQLASTKSYQEKNLAGVALPAMDFTGLDFSDWNLSHAGLHGTLTSANLAGANLSNASLAGSTLTHTNLTGAVVTGASFNDTVSRGFTEQQLISTRNYQDKNLTGIGLGQNDLSEWDFAGQDLSQANLSSSTLANTNLKGAVVTGADFGGDTSAGFTQQQLYSTQSYQEKNLAGIWLYSDDLKGWDFTGQNLSNATFYHSTLTNTNFTGANLTDAALSLGAAVDQHLDGAKLSGAVVSGAHFSGLTSSGFNPEQLYSTQSYQNKNLAGIWLDSNDLAEWDFEGQNLSHAHLNGSTLTNANLTGADVAGASFNDTVSRGFTDQQFTSTQSYQDRNLAGIGLGQNDLSGWDFGAQDLSHADLSGSTLTGASFAGALVAGASFAETTSRGFTEDQLHSTQSYQDKDLSGVGFYRCDLSGWDFRGQDLSGANLMMTDLANTDLSGAVVAGTSFYDTVSRGFTADQLYSTKSYREKDLQGIRLDANNLTGWDFTGQDLRGAQLAATLDKAKLTGADLRDAELSGSFLQTDLRFADLRGSTSFWRDLQTALTAAKYTHNTISNYGRIKNLELLPGERLVVRDDDGLVNPAPVDDLPGSRPPMPLTVFGSLAMSDGGILELRFDADPWDSLISFAPGIPVDLGGTLDLTFAKDVDPVSQLGHTLRLFNWTGVSPTGAFTVSSLYDWDLSQLYTTGEVTLLAAGGQLAGDSNGDGKVDLGDFGTLKDHFGAAGSKSEGDANGDGQIDLSDFGLLKANFGKSAAAVPEPTTWLLALLAAVGCALAYRRRWPRTRSRWRPPCFFAGNREWAKTIGRTQLGSAFTSRLAATIVLAMGVADATNANAALVSYWAGEGNANDSVGANSGILQDGVTFGPGVVGQAFQFDGNSYVEAPTLNLPTGHHNRTLSLWFEIEQRDDDHESFFAGYGKFGTYNATYHLGSLADGRVFFSQWGLGESRLAVGKGEWHHLAVTNVGYLATLYLDGTDVGTQNFGGAIETARGSSFYLGRIPGELGDVRRLKGFVDEVRVYDTALSASEIAALAERSSLLPGDANGDGTVDLADFGILKANFGSGTTLAQGDFDGDSQVGLSDFGILKDNFGKSGATAVPEPAALALLATGLLCLGVHRLRRSGNAA